MARIKQGDTEALRELIEAHQHRVIGTVAKIANNDEVLIDIAENTRVRVLRATITSVLAKPVPASAKDEKNDKDEADEEAAGEKSESAPPSGN